MSWWFKVGQTVRYTNKKWGEHPLQDKQGIILVKGKGIKNYLIDFDGEKVVVSGWNLRKVKEV